MKQHLSKLPVYFPSLLRFHLRSDNQKYQGSTRPLSTTSHFISPPDTLLRSVSKDGVATPVKRSQPAPFKAMVNHETARQIRVYCSVPRVTPHASAPILAAESSVGSSADDGKTEPCHGASDGSHKSNHYDKHTQRQDLWRISVPRGKLPWESSDPDLPPW